MQEKKSKSEPFFGVRFAWFFYKDNVKNIIKQDIWLKTLT